MAVVMKLLLLLDGQENQTVLQDHVSGNSVNVYWKSVADVRKDSLKSVIGKKQQSCGKTSMKID